MPWLGCQISIFCLFFDRGPTSSPPLTNYWMFQDKLKNVGNFLVTVKDLLKYFDMFDISSQVRFKININIWLYLYLIRDYTYIREA